MKNNFNGADFQKFIEVNKLKKKVVAEYLDVSAAFITQLTQGIRDIPIDKFALLKQNKEWDTSMLVHNSLPQKETQPTKIMNYATPPTDTALMQQMLGQISKLTEVIISQQRTIEQLVSQTQKLTSHEDADAKCDDVG